MNKNFFFLLHFLKHALKKAPHKHKLASKDCVCVHNLSVCYCSLVCYCCKQWNMLLTGQGSRSWQPYLWQHCCISVCSCHMGQTYRLWVDDMLMWRDHPTFLSTRAWSSNKMSRFTCTFTRRHGCAGMCSAKSERSRPHCHVLKTNARRQLVEMIAYSGANDKFSFINTHWQSVVLSHTLSS